MKVVKRYVMRYVDPPDASGWASIGDDQETASVPVAKVRAHFAQFAGLPSAVIVLPFNRFTNGSIQKRLKPRVLYSPAGKNHLPLRRVVNRSVADWNGLEATARRLSEQWESSLRAPRKKPAPKKRKKVARRASEWSTLEQKARQRAVLFYLNNGMSPVFARAAMIEFERRLRGKRGK